MQNETAFISEITLQELEVDPYPTWAKLRKHAPVAFVPAVGAWCVTRFAECELIGLGNEGFVGAKDHPTVSRVFGLPNVLSAEGETHKQIRAGINPRLQPKPVSELVDSVVRPIAVRHLQGIAGRGHGELMAEYFEPVSVEALRHVMGLDDLVDSATLRRWFHALNVGTSNFGLEPEGFQISDRVTAEIEKVLGPRLAYLIDHPDDSMLSHMLWTGRKREEGPRSLDLIMPSLKIILFGGMQEPGHAAGSTLLGLFSRPDQWAKLVADPHEYIPLAINEGLRWIAPIGLVERQATRQVSICGQTIEAGSIVQLVLSSANRDETRFSTPDLFDMERHNQSHQAFGNGSHFCAGHFFARQVEQIMFEELVVALPNLRQHPDFEPEVTGWVFRAPKVFKCVWDSVGIKSAGDASRNVHSSRQPLFSPDRFAETLTLVVKAVTIEADDVFSLCFVHPDGKPLPTWEPGAHIDLWLSPERAAQYSLCGDPARFDSWKIAVKREVASRGVSRFVHETLRPGMRVAVGFPRNHFPLGKADGYTFIAGGIGITPVLPMYIAVKAAGIPATLVYAGRSRTTMAFVAEIESRAGAGAIYARDNGPRADLREVVRAARDKGHVVYVCGPQGMLDAVEGYAAEMGVPIVAEHFDGADAHREGDFEFTVKLARTGEEFIVPADKTIMQVLDEHGYHARRSCKEGNCGSCETRLLAGQVDHRDVLLTPRQKAKNDRLMVCVSRAANPNATLVLDV